MDRSKVREKGTPSEQRENVRAGETASDGTVGDALRVAEQPASAPPSSYGMKEKPAETDGAPGRDSQETAAEENGQGAVSSGLVTRFIEDYAGTAERGDEESLRSDESGSVQLVGELSDPEGQGEGRALVRVTGVHHEIEQGHERIVVDLQGPISFKKYELPEQNIVYIALRQSTVPSRLRDGVIHVSSDIIKSMRLGQFTLEVARLVVRLEKRVNVSVFSVNDPDRVVLVLTEKDKGS